MPKTPPRTDPIIIPCTCESGRVGTTDGVIVRETRKRERERERIIVDRSKCWLFTN